VTQTVKTLLNQGLQRLKPVLGNDATTDVRVLLAYALDVDRGLLAARSQDPVSTKQSAIFQDAIERRYKRQPVAQIIGVREFWGREFIITPDVLDPRPDTETLIEEVLKAAPVSRLLDLGTGSGCILLTLLAEWPQAKGLGVDMSPKAIDIAQKNANALGLAARANLKQSNWFSNVTGQYDLIVSNPPYITADAMDTVAPEVRDWEPRMALTPEGDGLDAYRVIAQNAGDYLLENGRMFLEIGYDQAAAVLQIFSENSYSDGFCVQDMAGKDRVICVKKA
jgi:release factor glutamine methyltransferase